MLYYYYYLDSTTIHEYRLKIAAYPPSLAKELLSRRLANARAHNQTQSSNTARNGTYFTSNSRFKDACAPKLPEAVKARDRTLYADTVLVGRQRLLRTRAGAPLLRVRLEKVGCTVHAQYVIDKEIDRIYQMRRDIGHGSADCSDTAEGSRSRFLTGKAHLFLCPRALHRLEMASARICNQQIALEIQHSTSTERYSGGDR